MDQLLKKFGKANLVALMFITLLFPAVLGLVKIALLFNFLFSILFILVIGKGQKHLFNRHVITWLCCVLALNLFFVLWGGINGVEKDAFAESLNIYVLYPLFYVLLIASLHQVLSVRALTVILLSISITVSYIVITHVFRVRGIILPGYEILYLIYPELPSSINPVAFSGETGYLPRVMERLIFFAPFSVALIVTRKSIGLSRFIVWFNLLLVIVATIASERRVMLMVLLLSVIVVVARWTIVKPKRVAAVGLIGVGVIAVTVVLFSWNVTGNGVKDEGLTRIFNSYTDSDLTIREEQFAELVLAAAEVPLLGAGFGSAIDGYIRDPEHPWRFELTYVALLFYTGFLGVFLYGIVFILLLVIAINSFKRSGDIILPYMFGLSGGLIATITNPYLNYGTGQWVLFLPLAVFNCALLAKENKIIVEYRLPNRDVRSTG